MTQRERERERVREKKSERKKKSVCVRDKEKKSTHIFAKKVKNNKSLQFRNAEKVKNIFIFGIIFSQNKIAPKHNKM